MEPKTALYTQEEPEGSYKLPAHPHWSTLRTNKFFRVSNTRYGIPRPSAFHFRRFQQGNPVDQYAVSWVDSGGQLYVTSFAITPGFNQLFQFFPWTVRVEITRNDQAFPPLRYEMPGWYYNQNSKMWSEGITRYLTNGFVEYDSRIAYPQPSFGDVVDAIPQGTFDGVDVQRLPMPKDGPPGVEWPPQFDSWWSDQFPDTSS